MGSWTGSQANETVTVEGAVEVVDVDVEPGDVDVELEDPDVEDVGIDVEVEDVEVEMVKSTGMVCGVLVAPTPVTVMVVEYVPAASPGVIAVTVNEAGAVPETEESESHPAVVLALQFKVPVPELEMVTVCVAGSLPP